MYTEGYKFMSNSSSLLCVTGSKNKDVDLMSTGEKISLNLLLRLLLISNHLS